MERGLTKAQVEELISGLHSQRAINRGRAQWRVIGKSANGHALTVIYDHPHGFDRATARIVSVWWN